MVGSMNKTKLKYEHVFDEIIEKVIIDESDKLDEWDLPWKTGTDDERRIYWRNNQKECIRHFFHIYCLDAWKTEQEMLNDIGYHPFYMDVIEIATGKRLPL